MIGSIIGDIVGSIYEFGNMKSKEFNLFAPHASYTDDSILTIATADWLMNGGKPATYYADWGNAYPFPMGGYGSGFLRWLDSSHQSIAPPYNSCGNGSAMRVGPVGWAFNSQDEVLTKAKESAECTHNHQEGIKGAQATALAIMMARQGYDKETIRTKLIQLFNYDLNFTCDQIRPSYTWGATCQDSVPQAIVSFLDGNSFEDCVRNAISIGGDSDTIGCITGSIAEAYYGVPEEIRKVALGYIPEEFKIIINEFESQFGKK